MKRRLVLSFLALTFVVLVALEVPLALNYQQRLESELTANLVRDAFVIAGFSEETVEGRGSTNLDLVARGYQDRTGGRVVIVDQDGNVVADSDPESVSTSFASRPEFVDALAGRVATGSRRSDTLDTDLLYVAVPILAGGETGGAVRVTYSTAQIEEQRRSYYVALVGIAAVSMAGAAVLGILFARWVSRPLAQLEGAAAELGAGDLTVRASDAAGPPEVRELARAFNTMAVRLDELVEAQDAFVADASHQLRTPLAALRLRVENVQAELADLAPPGALDAATDDAAATSDAVRDAAQDDLDAALAETARLARIVDGLLTLARADRAGGPPPDGAVDLGTLLADRHEAWAPVGEEYQVRVEVVPTTARVLVTPDRLSQVLDNLIANAIDATPAGGRVRLHVDDDRPVGTSADGSAARSGGRPTARPGGRVDAAGTLVALHITDDGPGLSEEDRRRAFDRFWRAHQAPAALGGTGLGLSIARKLVRADGGEVELRPAPGGGLDAVVLLRRA